MQTSTNTATVTNTAIGAAFAAAGFTPPAVEGDDFTVCGVVELARELARTAGSQNRALIATLAEYGETSNWTATSERMLSDFAAELNACGYKGVATRKSELKRVLFAYASADFRALIDPLLASTSMGLQGAYKTAIKFLRVQSGILAAGSGDETVDDEGADIVGVAGDVATDAEAGERSLADVERDARAALKQALRFAEESERDDLIAAVQHALSLV